MRITWRVLAISVLLACTASTAAAQEPEPLIIVTAGFDGHCHQDSWCPIRVALSNEGNDLEGEIRLAVPDASGFLGTIDTYSREVVLPSRSRKAYFLYIPSPSSFSGYLSPYTTSGVGSIQFQVQLITSQRTFTSHRVTLRYLETDDRLYAIASSNPSALNFFNDVTPSRGQAFVSHMTAETMPSDPLGWEGLDVLVLNDIDTTAFSSDQQQALAFWLSQGGHLIVAGGAGGSQTAAGLTGLLPVTVEGMRTFQELDGLREYLGSYLDIPLASGPFAISEATLQEGRVLAWQEDLALIARRQVGAGTVDFVAFDASLNPFTNWEDNISLWESIIGPEDALGQRLTILNAYNAQRAVGTIPGIKPPSTYLIIFFFLAYTLLAGPVNFLVLRFVDRRELAWLTIPVLIFLFTGCAYVSGFLIRGRIVTVHRLAVVHVQQESQTGYVTELVGLFSPRRARYTVTAQNAGIRNVQQDAWATIDPMTIVQQDQGATLRDQHVDVGALHPFVAEGYVETVPPDTDLYFVDVGGQMQINGTLQNGPILLRDALVLTHRDEQYLGDLEPGQEISVNITGGTSSAQSDLADRISNKWIQWDDPEQYRRSQFLQALFPYNGPGLNPGVYLIGWGDQSLLDIQVVGKQSTTSQVTLYIYELPIIPPELGSAFHIPLSPQIYHEETTGYVDIDNNYISLSPHSSAVIHFVAWPEMDIVQVDQLTIGIQSQSPGSTMQTPILSLWNWETEQWEVKGLSWGNHIIPTPNKYVAEDGMVRVQLENTSDNYIGLDMITVSIEGKR